MATLEGCRGKESMPWSFFSRLGLGPGSLVPEFPHGFPTQPGDPFKHKGDGSWPRLRRSGSPYSLQERSEPFPIPTSLLSLLCLPPSPQQDWPQLCSLYPHMRSNVMAFTLVLPARTGFLHTWHISTGNSCLLSTSAAGFYLISHLNPHPEPVSFPLCSLPVM